MNRMRALLIVAVSAALLAMPAAAQADSRPLALGDSVMLGAKSALQQRGFAVDARESRQAWDGIKRLRRSDLPREVVVHLGTNGTLPDDYCRRLVSAVGPGHRLSLVTIKAERNWVRPNNRLLRRCAATYPDRVRVVDWSWAAGRRSGWLYDDGIHLRPKGAAAYARILDEALARG